MAALIVFAGCNKDKETEGTVLKASIEQQKGDGSKTSIVPISDVEAEIRWTAGDKIVVFNGTSSATFRLTNGAGTTNGTFTYNGEFEINDNTKAAYPETCVITDNSMTFTMPEEQNLAAPGSFANGANPMLGVNTGNGFTFVSVCGALGLSLTGDNVDITAIEIVSENEMLTGTYTGYFNNSNIDIANGTNSVRLNCSTKLTAEAKEFYIVLPVGVLANGFTLNIYNGAADPIFTKTTTTDLTVEINTVKKMNTLNVVPTVTPAVPEGAINGLFTINEAGDQVYFSKGNLQYIGSAATPYWKFADNQWDYLGNNGQGSNSQTANRDLFGWGTSGFNHGAEYYQPWSVENSYSGYNPYGEECNLYDRTGQADWGCNAISNGGNVENSGWRTITLDEMDYVIDNRVTTSGIRYVMGRVNGINGIILLPDEWAAITYELNSPNGGGYFSNNVSIDDWTNVLEANGAVFLPAVGIRFETEISDEGGAGYYWYATNSGNGCAKNLFFTDGFISTTGSSFGRSNGLSVRLVRNAE